MNLQELKETIQDTLHQKGITLDRYKRDLNNSPDNDTYTPFYIMLYSTQIQELKNVLVLIEDIDVNENVDNAIMLGYDAVKALTEDSRDLNSLEKADKFIKLVETHWWNSITSEEY